MAQGPHRSRADQWLDLFLTPKGLFRSLGVLLAVCLAIDCLLNPQDFDGLIKLVITLGVVFLCVKYGFKLILSPLSPQNNKKKKGKH